MSETSDFGDPHFIFNTQFSANGPGIDERITTIFYPMSVDSFQDVETQLTRHFNRGPLPDRIFLLGLEDLEDDLLNLAGDKSLEARLREISRFYNTPQLFSAAVTSSGRVRLRTPDHESFLNKEQTRLLFHSGMALLFKQYEGLISSRSGYHYVKPSKSHSEFFLRASHTLRSSREMFFIAAAAMQHLAEFTPDAIYTDTSSINGAALALATTLFRLGRNINPPVVESFGSYEGLAKSPPVGDAQALCLVSATTSGSLSAEISTKTGIEQDRHLYLYYLGASKPSVAVLCDLTLRDGSNSGLYDPITSWRPEDCPMCQQGHPTVELIGDQFFPASPTVTPRMLTLRDAPAWLSPLVKSVYGHDVIRCHYSDHSIGVRNSTVYLRLDGILAPANQDPDSLKSDVLSRLRRVLPAATGLIVHLGDQDSRMLAELALEILGDRGIDISRIRILNRSQLRDSDEFDLDNSVVFVVASGIVSSRSILEVSQTLRHLHPGGAIAYFVVLARMEDQAQWRTAVSNLGYGNNRPSEHQVTAVQEISLPSDRFAGETPWTAEEKFWFSVRDTLGSSDTLLPDDAESIFEGRLNQLQSAQSGGGLRDDLFLPGYTSALGGAATATALKLRPNFAFWKFDFTKLRTEPTQAEVFFTVHAILHQMRSGGGGRAASLTRDHNWNVLSPNVLERYNDAVIQASLLRGAKSFELDYSSDTVLSESMYRILAPILKSWRREEGAATSEVLYALASRRMRLRDADLDRLLMLIQGEKLPAVPRLLVAYLRSQRTNV